MSTSFTSAELVAGAGAGFSEHFFMFPFDTIKTRLQSGEMAHRGKTICGIFHRERFRNFYRGCVPVLTSAVPAHAAYFSVYEASKRATGESLVGIAFAAACATLAHDTISTPFDVVKQRMQMDSKQMYSSSLHCAKEVLTKEGSTVFFRSIPTTLAMNIPHFTTYWIAYEKSLSLLEHINQQLGSREYLLAGSFAGAFASIISFPFDTVKTHQQLSLSKSARLAVSNIVAQRGIRALYSGVTARVIHASTSSAIMMVTYENLKNVLESP